MINTNQDFFNYCIRRLGGGVVNVEITDKQIQDCFDHAISFYQEYHYDGMQRDFLIHQMTETDITNKYITVTDDIIGVIKVLNWTSMYNSAYYMFNPQYQIMASEIHNLTSSGGVQYFYSVMQYLGHLDFILQREKSFRFNRRANKIHLDVAWDSDFKLNDYVALEVYKAMDPEEYIEILNDRWLKEYMTALLKRDWGTNLSKYNGAMLPGGLQYNGRQIYQDAIQEIERLEQEAKDNSAVLNFMVG